MLLVPSTNKITTPINNITTPNCLSSWTSRYDESEGGPNDMLVAFFTFKTFRNFLKLFKTFEKVKKLRRWGHRWASFGVGEDMGGVYMMNVLAKYEAKRHSSREVTESV